MHLVQEAQWGTRMHAPGEGPSIRTGVLYIECWRPPPTLERRDDHSPNPAFGALAIDTS
jgi:hypothetical protein